ncbi:MAG: hypothetical protein JKY03_03200 [Aureispira sp.]|nr:hypothetical protein [Aureispira sp.]
MERKTKELLIILRPENIVETKVREGITELTVGEVDNITAAINEIYDLNDRPKASLVIAPPFYMKKEVLKTYSAKNGMRYIALALVANSFAARLVSSVMLGVRHRVAIIQNKKTAPSKVFADKEKAVEWLVAELEKYNNKA